MRMTNASLFRVALVVAVGALSTASTLAQPGGAAPAPPATQPQSAVNPARRPHVPWLTSQRAKRERAQKIGGHKWRLFHDHPQWAKERRSRLFHEHPQWARERRSRLSHEHPQWARERRSRLFHEHPQWAKERRSRQFRDHPQWAKERKSRLFREHPDWVRPRKWWLLHHKHGGGKPRRQPKPRYHRWY